MVGVSLDNHLRASESQIHEAQPRGEGKEPRRGVNLSLLRWVFPVAVSAQAAAGSRVVISTE